jgi:hypothetical protein
MEEKLTRFYEILSCLCELVSCNKNFFK